MPWLQTSLWKQSLAGHKQLQDIDCQISNISGTLIGNKIVDHSDVVGALPVGIAPTTSSFLT